MMRAGPMSALSMPPTVSADYPGSRGGGSYASRSGSRAGSRAGSGYSYGSYGGRPGGWKLAFPSCC
jgi:hypothetical protein